MREEMGRQATAHVMSCCGYGYAKKQFLDRRAESDSKNTNLLSLRESPRSHSAGVGLKESFKKKNALNETTPQYNGAPTSCSRGAEIYENKQRSLETEDRNWLVHM